MKKILFLTLLILVNLKVFSQGNTCATATPFCLTAGNSFTFPNVHNGSIAPTGNQYGCLCQSQANNPSWFYIKTTGAGNMNFTVAQSGGLDVDFVLWGPFTAATFPNACNNLTGGCSQNCGSYSGTTCSGNIADCESGPSATEQLNVPSTAAGQYFILMVTNFDGGAGNITITQNSGPGSDCSISCNPTTIPMGGNYAATPTVAVASGSTLTCNTFYIHPNQPTFTNPYTDIYTPCLMVDFNPWKANINTKGELKVYEGATQIFDLCNTCSQGSIGGTVATAGNDFNLYFSYLDTAQSHSFVFCNSGVVGSTTVSVKNCWDGTVYAGPTTWNTTATASCFTLSVPANTKFGWATYSITPNPGTGFTDSNWGYGIVDPSIMPAGTYTVTYHFKGYSKCPPGNGTYVFTVPPKPTITISPTTATVCPGGSASLTGGGGSTYTWSPAASLSSSTGTTVSTSTTLSATQVYTVTGTASTGCKNTATATVNVSPTPTLNITAAPTAICIGGSSTLTVSGATSYTWTGGTTPTSGSVVTVSPTNTATPTVYTVTGSNGACTATKTISVSVNPLPVITAVSNPTAICVGGTATLTAGGASTYTWSAGTTPSTGSPVTVAPTNTAAATVYTVTGTSAAGCVNTKTVSVTVNALPVVTAAASPTAICFGGTATLTAGGASTYAWSAGTTPSTGSPVTVSPTNTAAATVYTVTGTSAAGCVSTKTVSVTVNPLPAINATASPTAVCEGFSSTLTASGASTYSWSPASGLSGASTGASVTTNTTLSSSQVFTVTGTSAANCVNSNTVNLTVNPLPAITATANPNTICTGTSSTLTASGGSTYTWTAGTTPGTGPVVTVSPTSTVAPTVYTVTSTDVNGCKNNATVSVGVATSPTISIVGSHTASICKGQTTATLQATGASTYTWSPATGLSPSTGASVVASPTATQVYTVSGSLGSCGGLSTATVQVKVNALPTMTLSPTPSVAVCQNSSVNLSTAGTATLYTWSPATSLSATTGTTVTSTPTGTANITYTVKGKDANGCTVTKTVTVTVNPQPTLTLTASSSTVCAGGNVILTASSTNLSNASYTWSTGATTGSNTLSVSPSVSPTTYTVVASNTVTGCSAIFASTTVTVSPTPSITVTNTLSTSSSTICLNNSVTLTASGVSSYTWSPAAGLNTSTGSSVVSSPTVVGTPVIYTVTGTSASGCLSSGSASGTFTVLVNPLPDISITASSLTVCTGNSSTLTANGAGTGGTYSWNPSSTLSSSTGAVVSTDPNNTVSPIVYTVTGTNSNGCTSTATVNITTNITPTVSVSGGGPASQTVCGSGTVNNNVSGITFSVTPAGSVNWTNSNPAIGLAASGSANIAGYPAPTVTNTTTGIITATAVATNGCASSNSTQLVYTITINPAPGINTPTITPAGCGLNNGIINGVTGLYGSGNYQYSWNGGTFGTANSYTNAAGTYNVQVEDVATGCITSQNITLPNAGAPASPTITPGSATACAGSNVVFNIPSPDPTYTYSWTEADGTTGTGTSYTVVNLPGSPNPYYVNVTATSSLNCTGVAGTASITVNPLPSPSISTSTTTICQGGVLTLSVSPNGPGYTYQWYNGATSIPGATSDTYTATASGNYSVSVTNTATSCNAGSSATQSITVNALPVINATSNVTVTPSNCTSNTGVIDGVNISGNGPFTYTWTSTSLTGSVVGTGTVLPATANNLGAGNYCIAVTDINNCPASYCSVAVNNAGAPSSPLSISANDTVYCQGDVIQTLTVTTSGTVTPIVNWYDASNTPLATNTTVYTPNALPVGTTTLYVDATVNGCSSIKKPITILVNPLPQGPSLSGSVPNPVVQCQGTSSQTISVVTNGTVTSTPVWYNGGTFVTAGTSYTTNPSTAGTTVYTIVDSANVGGCKNLSAGNVLTVTVTINPTPTAPSFTNSLNSVYCQGSSIPQLNAAPVGGSTVTAIWHDQNGVTYPNPFTPSNAPGTYTYTALDSANTGGCLSNVLSGNVVSFTVNPTPTAPNFTNTLNSSYCAGTSIPQLNAAAVGGSSVTVIWHDQNGNSYPNPFTPSNVAGTYTYTALDSANSGGCLSAVSAGNVVTLTVNPTPTAPNFTNTLNGSYCAGASIPQLNAAAVGGSSVTVIWHDQNGNSYPNPFTPSNAAGTYTYTALDSANAGGCLSTASAGNVVTLTVNATPSSPTLTANSGSSCFGAAINPISAAAAGGSTVVWHDQNGQSHANPLNPLTAVGQYTYTAIDSTGAGCMSAVTSANVFTYTVNPNPAIDTTNKITVGAANCGQPTGSVSINSSAITNGTPAYTYQWYDNGVAIAGATSLTLTGQGSGNYNLVVTDQNGCKASIAAAGSTGGVVIPASAGVVAQFSTTPSPATGTIPLTIDFINQSTGATSYLWNFGDILSTPSTSVNSTYTYNNAGTYTVTLIASNGPCHDTATAIVIAEIPTTIIIPNIFSPNGDSINDVFYIKNTGMNSLHCDIFNRWGQLVYTITAPNDGWDGTMNNGEKASEGTYMYILVAEGLDKKEYKQQGTVTLVK